MKEKKKSYILNDIPWHNDAPPPPIVKYLQNDTIMRK